MSDINTKRTVVKQPVTVKQLAAMIHARIADAHAAVPTVDRLLCAGRIYDRTGHWPRHIIDDRDDEWRDLWMFAARLCQNELEAPHAVTGPTPPPNNTETEEHTND